MNKYKVTTTDGEVIDVQAKYVASRAPEGVFVIGNVKKELVFFNRQTIGYCGIILEDTVRVFAPDGWRDYQVINAEDSEFHDENGDRKPGNFTG